MSDLRTGLIDIIERADLAPDEQLDAMLDLLTERADDIPLPFRFAVAPIVAVLRNPGSHEDEANECGTG